MDEATPTDRELDILKVLWELGSASVRQVRERLCPNDELAFNTVQTLLRIMDDKGLVSHESQGRSFVYTPRYSRERATSRFLQQVFDGAMDQVIVSMLSTTDAGPEELKQLEKIIAQSRRRKERRTERRRSHEMPYNDILYSWLVRSALLNLTILLIGSGAVLVWRQPVRRVRVIELVLAGCLIAPWLGMIPGYPQLAVVWGRAAAIKRQEVLCNPWMSQCRRLRADASSCPDRDAASSRPEKHRNASPCL